MKEAERIIAEVSGVLSPKDSNWNDFCRFLHAYKKHAIFSILSDGETDYTVSDIKEMCLNPALFKKVGSRLSGESKAYSIRELAELFQKGYRLACYQSSFYIAPPVEQWEYFRNGWGDAHGSYLLGTPTGRKRIITSPYAAFDGEVEVLRIWG